MRRKKHAEVENVHHETSGVSNLLLRVENLNVDLGGRSILHDISFTADRGEWIGIVGPNGSGKTTLLRSIGGFLDYTGEIDIDGRRVGSWPRRDLARILAFLRQTHQLSFDFTVRDFVLMGKTPYKGWLETTNQDDLAAMRTALAEVNLASFESRDTSSLSGGELQRVFLAQALVQDAELLLLDEPTTHLDVFHQFELLEHVRSVVESGKGAVAVFHDLEQALRFCDRVLVLDDGYQRAFDRPEDVINADIIRDVFHMEALVDQVRGLPGITYLRPSSKPINRLSNEDLHENR